jgi:hypothetical protein
MADAAPPTTAQLHFRRCGTRHHIRAAIIHAATCAACIHCVKALQHPPPDKNRWRRIKLFGHAAKLAKPGNRDPDSVNLGRVSSTLAPALAGRWHDLSALLGLSASFSFGGLARERLPDAFAHRPSSYSLISELLAAQAVAPHQRVSGG